MEGIQEGADANVAAVKEEFGEQALATIQKSATVSRTNALTNITGVSQEANAITLQASMVEMRN